MSGFWKRINEKLMKWTLERVSVLLTFHHEEVAGTKRLKVNMTVYVSTCAELVCTLDLSAYHLLQPI
jgi:hypothetical protein